MPKTERELEKLVFKQNISRTHHRALNGEYGYNHILSSDLVSECIKLYEAKKKNIRVLDIGCGDGFALKQLQEEIKAKGLGGRFEFVGLGENLYEEMYIPRDKFIEEGIYDYKLDSEPFDLVISVYTFQYVWHKLEALENIYNSLMSDGAKAIIHFPGYLVKNSEDSSELLLDEKEGNEKFSQFIKKWSARDENPKLSYHLVPYYSNDGETLFTEFGNLRFQKEGSRRLSFGTLLKGFSIYDEGFTFCGLDKKLSYVASIYNLKPLSPLDVFEAEARKVKPKLRKKHSVCRVVTLSQEYQNKKFNLHLGVHHLRSKKIIGIYPAGKEELSGYSVPYQQIAMALRTQKAGAVVRCNGLYDPSMEFHEFNDFFVRLFMDYILKNAKNICGFSKPEIYLMGYSSGGSAVASIASEYEPVKKMLLIAPSYDADEDLLQRSMNNYKGELYIVAGEQDDVVLPSQVAWFYFQAKKAKLRKFVELKHCEHSFNGFENKEIISKAPFWAFNDSSDFPEETVPLVV